MNAAPGSLLREHFLHYFSEEVPTGEWDIRTSERTPSLTLTEQTGSERDQVPSFSHAASGLKDRIGTGLLALGVGFVGSG
jgi:hypothetical protein